MASLGSTYDKDEIRRLRTKLDDLYDDRRGKQDTIDQLQQQLEDMTLTVRHLNSVKSKLYEKFEERGRTIRKLQNRLGRRKRRQIKEQEARHQQRRWRTQLLVGVDYAEEAFTTTT